LTLHLSGNSNAGHEFRDAPPNTPGVIGPSLTRDQRLDIIEYLKVLVSDQIAQNTKNQLPWGNAVLDAMAPYYERYTGSVQYGTPEKQVGWKRTDFCNAIMATKKAEYSEPRQKK
jgi:hypothetical protein